MALMVTAFLPLVLPAYAGMIPRATQSGVICIKCSPRMRG